ncbi:hypothetical protein FRC02_004175 [Tulasnella sp. 418]|nr:hypothetical protein FRC02_004175 [Tulasnella sp. 418]
MHSSPSDQSSTIMDEKYNSGQPGRHPVHYHSSAIVLQVESTLYRVDKSLLCRFQVFRDMFEGASGFIKDQSEGDTDENPIKLQGVTTFEMDTILDMFDYHCWTGPPALSLEQWKAVLHLSTMWHLPELRDLAIKNIDTLKPSPIDAILLAQKFLVQQWLKPAYVQLCARLEPLSAEEGERLGVQAFVDLAKLREKTRATPPIYFCRSCKCKGEWWCKSCSVICDALSAYHCRKCDSGAQFWCKGCSQYCNAAYPESQDRPDLTEGANKVVDEFLKSSS